MTAPHSRLSRRERQIMDILYQKRRATAVEVMEALTDAPTNATTRTLLRILEAKGHVRHEKDGVRFVYLPTLHPKKAHCGRLPCICVGAWLRLLDVPIDCGIAIRNEAVRRSAPMSCTGWKSLMMKLQGDLFIPRQIELRCGGSAPEFSRLPENSSFNRLADRPVRSFS